MSEINDMAVRNELTNLMSHGEKIIVNLVNMVKYCYHEHYARNILTKIYPTIFLTEIFSAKIFMTNIIDRNILTNIFDKKHSDKKYL